MGRNEKGEILRFLLVCDSKKEFCGCQVWIRGSEDHTVNAIELDDDDSNWNEACIHIQCGDYYIKDSEYDDDGE